MRLYDVNSDTSTRMHSDASLQTSVLSDMHKQPGNVSLLLLSMCKQSDFFFLFLATTLTPLPKQFSKIWKCNPQSVRIKNIFRFQKNAFSLLLQQYQVAKKRTQFII